MKCVEFLSWVMVIVAKYINFVLVFHQHWTDVFALIHVCIKVLYEVKINDFSTSLSL